MNILKKVKNYIYKWDFFCSAQLLRYKTQSEYRTLLGGIMSMIIVIGLTLTFYNKLIDTFNKVLISSTSDNINAIDLTPFNLSTYPGKKFMFGVEVYYIDLNAEYRLFDVVLSTSYQNRQDKDKSDYKQYHLQPCTLDHWSDFREIQKDFDKLYMKQWLCLPKNSQFTLRGKFSSLQYQSLSVTVYKCTDSWEPQRPCLDYWDIYTNLKGNQFFTVYFTNPAINPTSQEHLKYYLEDNNYIIFTQKQGAAGYLFVEEFNITTDESLLPFEETHEESGGIIRDFAVKHPFEVGYSYCSFTFVKSGNGQSYERKFMKIDEILSYIGGLIGIIVACLFIINDFNSSSYLIELGSVLFNTKDKMPNKKMKSYNFLDFISCAFYQILSMFKISPSCKTINDYNEYEDELSKQLDIVYLLKRVTFLERALNVLLEDHHLVGLHLQQKLTLEQAKNLRRKFMIRRNLNKSSASMNDKATNRQNRIKQSLETIPANFEDNLNLDGSKMNRWDLEIVRNNNNMTNASCLNLKMNRNEEEQEIYDDLESDGESQSEGEENFQSLNLQIEKLKHQSSNGKSISRKIWEMLDTKIKNDLETRLNKQRTLNNSFANDSQLSPYKKVRRFQTRKLIPINDDNFYQIQRQKKSQNQIIKNFGRKQIPRINEDDDVMEFDEEENQGI